MNDKELDLKMLENADNETMKQIAENCPASDVEMERMFAMSRKIYNERTKESNNKDNIEVSGVEHYRKPVWQKFAAIAAALVITGGAVAGGMFFMKNRNTFNNDPLPVATDPATSPSTKTVEGCPFGDISNDKVKMSGSAYLPSVIDVSPDTLKFTADSFNKGKWTELSEAFTTEEDYVTLFIYNNGAPYQLVFYYYNSDDSKKVSIKYSDGNNLRYFTGDEVIKKAAQALGLAGATDTSLDTIITLEEPYNDLVHKVWEKNLSEKDNSQANTGEEVEVPRLVDVEYKLAKVQLQERGLNYNIVKKSDNTVPPGYVIRTEPAEGTLVNKEAVITLYVSAEDTSADSDNGNTEVSAEDAELIAKAQQLYEKAIETDLKYGRSAPQYFNIDTKNCFTQVDGPTLSYVYDITLDELRAQYHEIFCDRYAENNTTIEKYYYIHNDQLCWLTGNPGVDPYLESTTVTRVLRKTDDEIFFEVEKHYTSSPFLYVHLFL